jgi:hypothetical protein
VSGYEASTRLLGCASMQLNEASFDFLEKVIGSCVCLLLGFVCIETVMVGLIGTEQVHGHSGATELGCIWSSVEGQ